MSIKIFTLVAAVVMISCDDSGSRSKASKRRNADQKLVSYIEKKVTNLKYFDEY